VKHHQRAEREDQRQRDDLLDRRDQLVAVDQRREGDRQGGQRRPDAVEPDPPGQQPRRAGRGGEDEGVEGLEGPDQRQAEQERGAAEQRVRPRRVARVEVGAEVEAVGVAQVQVRVGLAVVQHVVRADHVQRGVGQDPVGGERHPAREQHGREREQVGGHRRDELPAVGAPAAQEPSRPAPSEPEPGERHRGEDVRRPGCGGPRVGRELRDPDERGHADRGQQHPGQEAATRAVHQEPGTHAQRGEHDGVEERDREEHGRASLEGRP